MTSSLQSTTEPSDSQVGESPTPTEAPPAYEAVAREVIVSVSQGTQTYGNMRHRINVHTPRQITWEDVIDDEPRRMTCWECLLDAFVSFAGIHSGPIGTNWEVRMRR